MLIDKFPRATDMVRFLPSLLPTAAVHCVVKITVIFQLVLLLMSLTTVVSCVGRRDVTFSSDCNGSSVMTGEKQSGVTPASAHHALCQPADNLATSHGRGLSHGWLNLGDEIRVSITLFTQHVNGINAWLPVEGQKT